MPKRPADINVLAQQLAEADAAVEAARTPFAVRLMQDGAKVEDIDRARAAYETAVRGREEIARSFLSAREAALATA